MSLLGELLGYNSQDRDLIGGTHEEHYVNSDAFITCVLCGMEGLRSAFESRWKDDNSLIAGAVCTNCANGAVRSAKTMTCWFKRPAAPKLDFDLKLDTARMFADSKGGVPRDRSEFIAWLHEYAQTLERMNDNLLKSYKEHFETCQHTNAILTEKLVGEPWPAPSKDK
ncbi:Uncharacterised protein [uncultured archaeon]|nr:Uncharacterised protein [uncultured archaeon]